MDFSVRWAAEMGVARAVGADGGGPETDPGWKYRSLAYRLVKNYGVRPRVFARLVDYAGRDALGSLREVARGGATPSGWLGTGRDIVTGLVGGSKDGAWAQLLDRSTRRNPYGWSVRSDRAVAVYDQR